LIASPDAYWWTCQSPDRLNSSPDSQLKGQAISRPAAASHESYHAYFQAWTASRAVLPARVQHIAGWIFRTATRLGAGWLSLITLLSTPSTLFCIILSRYHGWRFPYTCFRSRGGGHFGCRCGCLSSPDNLQQHHGIQRDYQPSCWHPHSTTLLLDTCWYPCGRLEPVVHLHRRACSG
jgi:hypothetical protein